MVDGSVHFVNDTVDTGDLTIGDVASPAGVSPWGVWGAIGSRAGEERVALDNL
jgi:hypothetical protein